MKNITDKQWLEEYAKDMRYKFEVKTGKNPYRLIRGKETFQFATAREARNHVLKDLHKYIGEHTSIVDSKGKTIEKAKKSRNEW